MVCLNESDLQGYLEESGPTPLRRMVENHMTSCAECRAAFDRVVATHQRVNAWISELSSPADHAPVETRAALGAVLQRIAANAIAQPANITGEDHLARLLAPDTEIPWYKTIVANVRDFIRPEQLPPLVLTSQPVAVRDIRGRGISRSALASSLLLQGALVAALMMLGTNATVQKAIRNVVVFAPPPPVKVAEMKQAAGGGQRSPLPALKASLPKPAPRVFTPPLVTIEHPQLTMDPSLIAATDAWAAPTGAIGNPLGAIGGGGGLGSGSGIGNGRGNGIGSGNGSGVGGAGVFSAGNGITAPTLLSKVEPEYSEEARKAKYSGAVVLSIVVNTDGKAEDIRVIRSLGMGLDEKAIEAVQKWRFNPGRNKSVPVKVRAQIEVNFRLL